jgi:rubrerythrin
MRDGPLLRFTGGRKREPEVIGTVTRPHFPMDRALLCLDCDSVFEAESEQKCPACGSTIAWAIGRALNRGYK